MTGTEQQRKRSARMLALVLLGLAITAGVGALLPFALGVLDPVRPAFLAAAFGACSLVALVAAALEFQRHPLAEALALAAAIVGTPLVWAAVSNAWFLFVPVFEILVLAVFLALAYRFAVRSDERHRSRRSLGA